MKTKILSILLGALSIIFSACSTDVAPEPDTPSPKGDSFLRLEIQKQDLTRGFITSSFKEGDIVEILIRPANKHGYPIVTRATYNSGEWKLDAKIDLSEFAMTQDEQFIIWAIYPGLYLESTEIQQDTMVFSNLYNWGDNGVVNEDILTGDTYVTPSDPTAKIICSHLKSRLTFALKNNADRDIKISRVSVENSGKYNFLAARMDINNIDRYYELKEFTDSCSFGCNVDIPAGETSNLDFLLFPTYIPFTSMMKDIDENGGKKTVLNFTLEVKVPSTGKTSTTNFTIDADAWYSGRQYTYPVSLFKKNKRNPIPDSDEYVDLGLSVLWAKCNVGASTPEDIGKFFFWGGTKGFDKEDRYSSNEVAFVSNKTYAELLESSIVEPDPINDNIFIYGSNHYRLTPPYDAATQNLGNPWRMPNDYEIMELVDNTTMEWVQDGDKWILKLKSTVPGFEDRYLILPGPGGYFTGGTFQNFVNIIGFWWGSAPYNHDPLYAHGLLLRWEQPYDLHEKAHISSGANPVGDGMNVRAVRPIENN